MNNNKPGTPGPVFTVAANAAPVAASAAPLSGLNSTPEQGTGTTMTISAVAKDQRGKSPIISTANQVNAKTTAKKKVNKNGEMVAAVKSKQPRISNGVRIFSTKSQLISMVKQGDPPYDVVKKVGNGFRFYGKVVKADPKKGWWHIEYDLFPTHHKSLRVNRGLCTTISKGQDEPTYDLRKDKVDQALANLEMLESEPEEDFDLVLPDSDDDDDEAGAMSVTKKKKKKSRKVLSLESFLTMSDDGVLASTSFDHF